MEDDKVYPRRSRGQQISCVDFDNFTEYSDCTKSDKPIEKLLEFIKASIPKQGYDYYKLCEERDDGGYYNTICFYKYIPETDEQYKRRILHIKREQQKYSESIERAKAMDKIRLERLVIENREFVEELLKKNQ